MCKTTSGYLISALFAFSFAPLTAQTPTGTEYFEKEIRPVLAEKCYGCHSSKSKSPMGGLVLDTKSGMTKHVTGKAAPKPAARPAPVTKGKPPQGRR